MVTDVDRLGGKRLVELPQIDVVDREAVPRQEFGNRVNRTDSHLLWPATHDGHADLLSHRLQPLVASRAGLHKSSV